MIILIICFVTLGYTIFKYGKLIHPMFLNDMERLCDDEYKFILRCITSLKSDEKLDKIEKMIFDWYNSYDNRVNMDYMLMRFDILLGKLFEQKSIIKNL